MSCEKRVSVIVTLFNGKEFIEEQIYSILKNLGKNDELLISDDGSTDGSFELVSGIALKDNRISVLEGPKKGLNSNIRFLLNNVKGQYIFISDQDDVWFDNKVELILDIFYKNPNCEVVHHNARLIDEFGKISSNKSVYDTIKIFNTPFRFFMKPHCFGSMMAFRRSFLKYDFVPTYNCYDTGLTFYGIRSKKIIFVDNILMSYRRHGNNLSTFKRRKFSVILVSRMHLLFFVILRVLFLKERKYEY